MVLPTLTVAAQARELARPRFHLTPVLGWMNDPNGLVVDADGRLHAFFQYEPDRPSWGRMRWGHAVSSDMLQWEHGPIALDPDPMGVDSAGCWSGSIVTPIAGPPTAFYTGVSEWEGVRKAAICSATSDDGLLNWTKAVDPVIAGPPDGVSADGFRDPFVWHDGATWSMLVGAGSSEHEGLILLYRSRDLRTWSFAGPFLAAQDVRGRVDLPIADLDSPCWECPQLLHFDRHDLLIVSIVDRAPAVRPAHVVAFAGRVQGDRFVVERAQRLGMGPDFYAPAATRLADGRHLLFGWIPEDPPDPGSVRSWAGSLTFPRVVTVDDDGFASITLAREVDRIHGRRELLQERRIGDGRTWSRIFHEPYLELRARFDASAAPSFRIDLEGPDGLEADLRFARAERLLTVSRMGRVEVAGRDPQGSAVLPLGPDRDKVELRLIIDGSVVEVVANETVTATIRRPDTPGGGRIVVTPLGGSLTMDEAEVTQF